MFDLDQLIDVAMFSTDSDLAAAERVLGRVRETRRAHSRPARSKRTPDPDQEALRAMAEAGLSLTVPIPEPDDRGSDPARMTESARRVWMGAAGLPIREGSYTNADGSRVQFTDAQVLRDVADLWAVVKAEYRGTPSMENQQLQQMLGNLESGRPLSGTEFDLLKRFKDKYGKELEAFRASPEGKAEGYVEPPPEGSGRVTREAGQALADVGGVPLRMGTGLPPRSEPSTDPMALLREAGVAIREAGPGQSAGTPDPVSMDDVPPHQIVAVLNADLPEDHEDRPAIERLRRRGAALDVEERDEVSRLAGKHSDLLGLSEGQPGLQDAVDAEGVLHAADADLAESGYASFLDRAAFGEGDPLAGIPRTRAGI